MIVIGAKGHCTDLMTLLSEEDRGELLFFDDVSIPKEDLFLGEFRIIHSIGDINFDKCPDFVSGIGQPMIRRVLVEKFESFGGKYQKLVSKRAIVGKYKVVLGKGVTIMPQVFISNNVIVGKGTLVNTGARIHHDVIIGSFCDIAPSASLLGSVSIGDNCFIGAGAILLPGVSLGDNIVVGAGSIVTKDFLENDIKLVGAPARVV